jgi:hypothetical protein
MRAAAVLVLLLSPALALAQTPAGQPVVRTRLVPAEGIVIGQPVRLDVQVLFPGEMPHPPRVSIGEAAGAQIMRFETQATTMRDQIAGQPYTGQSFEFVLFPRRGGEIAVPAPAVTLLDRAGDPYGSAEGEATRFAVTVPPGIDPSGPVLAADHVSVEQSWSPDPARAELKPGSALVRTIRRRADGVPALGMAEFAFAAPAGVRVYIDPPLVEDRTNRGAVEGSRTDKVTYVFERPGNYALPALSQPWWSLSGKQARSESLPGVLVTIAAAAPAEQPGSQVPFGWPGLLAALALACLMVGGLAWLAPRLVASARRVLGDYRASEFAARRDLDRAARSGNASASYQALRIWLQRLPNEERALAGRDNALTEARMRLEQSLFGAGSPWGREAGASLAASIGAFRRQRRESPRREAGPLPPLNPGASA